MKNKQTAVEWLTEKMKISLDNEFKYVIGFFQQAKEMEKQQIIDAYKEGCFDNILDESTDKIRSEQYYNETFKQNGNK